MHFTFLPGYETSASAKEKQETPEKQRTAVTGFRCGFGVGLLRRVFVGFRIFVSVIILVRLVILIIFICLVVLVIFIGKFGNDGIGLFQFFGGFFI